MLSMCHQVPQVHAQSVSWFPVHAVMDSLPSVVKLHVSTDIRLCHWLWILIPGWTPLHCAIFWGCAQTARALLALGADANLVFPDHDNDNGWPQASSPTVVAHNSYGMHRMVCAVHAARLSRVDKSVTFM